MQPGDFDFFEYEPGSPEIDATVGGSITARRKVWFRHDDLPKANDFFLGGVEQRTAGGVTYLARGVPDLFPPKLSEALDGGDLWATGIKTRSEGEPQHDTSNPTAPFGKAALCSAACTYSGLTYEPKPDQDVRHTDGFPHDLGAGGSRYISRFPHPGSRIDTIRGGGLWFSDTGERLIENFPYRILGGDFVMVWHMVPNPPWTAIINASNRINDATFDGIWPAETVMFTTFEAKPYVHLTSGLVWDLTYHFAVELNINAVGTATGFNYKYHWNAGLIVPGRLTGAPGAGDAAKVPFRTFDLRKLFRPDQ